MDAYNHHESTNADGLTFEAWLNAVDRVLLRVVYVTHDCLGDWDAWRGWQENMPPAEAAVELLDHDDTSILVPELEAQLWAAAQQEMGDSSRESRTWRGKSQRSMI